MSQPATKNYSEVSKINGVDIHRLQETVKAIKENPKIAKFEFRNHNKWIDGAHNRSTIKGFYGANQEDATRTKPFTLDASEPPILLGKDEAPNPVEYVLHALASCLTTSTAYHAAAQGVEIEGIESEIQGDLDLQGFLGLNDSIRKGYQNIQVTLKIKTKAPKEKVEELFKNSPVFDTVTNPVPVTVKIETK